MHSQSKTDQQKQVQSQSKTDQQKQVQSQNKTDDQKQVQSQNKTDDQKQNQTKINYQLEPIHEKDKEEAMALYRGMIGSEGCTWDGNYPNEEIFDLDVKRGNIYGIKNEKNQIIALISYDVDEAVANLSCWSLELKKVAEYARLCVHQEYQNQGLTKVLFKGSEKVLQGRGYDGAHYIVSKTNERAIAAYKKFQFAYKGEVRLFHHDWYAYEQKFH